MVLNPDIYVVTLWHDDNNYFKILDWCEKHKVEIYYHKQGARLLFYNIFQLILFSKEFDVWFDLIDEHYRKEMDNV